MNKSMLAIVGALLVIGLGVLGIAGWSWNHRAPNVAASIPVPAIRAQGQGYYNASPMGPGMMGSYGPMGPGMMGPQGSWMGNRGGMHGSMMGGWGYWGAPGGQSYTPTPTTP